MAMVESSGQFDADGLAHVRSSLEQHLAGEGDGLWLTAIDEPTLTAVDEPGLTSDDGEPVGVAYCAPEPVTSGTWNLLMLWTRADRHGKGFGSGLVRQVENELQRRRARLLIVETSSLEAFAAARAFYAKCGFFHEATIKDFFSDGDDKLVFTKPVAD